MSKKEFLAQLRKGLSGLPQNDITERLTFYSEMIDDRMEEGLSEDEAVSAAGKVEEIIAQAMTDIPLTKLAKEHIKSNRRLAVWEIILLALGAPIWLSLGISAAAVIFSLYISLWAVILSLWAAFISLAVCSFAISAVGLFFTCNGNALSGIAMIGAGIACIGLSIFMFYGCKAATKGILLLCGKFTVWTKNCFIKRRKRNG